MKIAIQALKKNKIKAMITVVAILKSLVKEKY
jgi:hypothetical protein